MNVATIIFPVLVSHQTSHLCPCRGGRDHDNAHPFVGMQLSRLSSNHCLSRLRQFQCRNGGNLRREDCFRSPFMQWWREMAPTKGFSRPRPGTTKMGPLRRLYHCRVESMSTWFNPSLDWRTKYRFQYKVLRYASWICLHVCVTPPSWIPGGGIVVCVILRATFLSHSCVATWRVHHVCCVADVKVQFV